MVTIPPRSLFHLRIPGLLAVACLPAGCVDKILEGDVPPTERLLVGLQPSALTVAQGGETTLTATVTRPGSTRGQVTLSVEGLPAGVTTAIEGQSTVAAVTTATIRLRVGAATAPGVYQVTVRGRGSSVLDGVTLLRLEVVLPASFSLGLSQAALTLVHGGRAPLEVRLQRSNLLAPVTLALEGAAGVTGTFGPNPATDTLARLTVTVALAVAPGTYSLKVRGSAPGVADQQATLALMVTADPMQVFVSPEQTAFQGSTASIDVLVNRSTYAGPVALSVANLPAGVSASFQPTAPQGDSAVLLLAPGALVSPGSYPITVRGTGEGVPDASTTFTLVLKAASIALALGPESLSLLPGTSGTTRLTLNRIGFGGPAAVSIEGAPAGLSIAPAGLVLGADAEHVTVSAAAVLAPGEYQLTIRATPLLPGPGSLVLSGFPGRRPSLEESSSALTVTVHPLSAGNGNVTLDWSGCALPTWVAYQDGTGPWIQILPSTGAFHFTVSAGRGGYAYVEGRSLVVRFATQAELTAQPIVICRPAPTTKTVSATGLHFNIPPNLVDPPIAWFLGSGSGTSSATTQFFVITGVAPGVHDLVAWGTPATLGSRIVLRRDLDPPDGSDLGVLNMRGEGFVPAATTLSVTGGAGDRVSHSMSYLTTQACDVARLYTMASVPDDPANQTMSGVPVAMQRPGDYHLLAILADATDGGRRRSVVFSALGAATRIENLPPKLPPVTVLSLPGTFKRLSGSLNAVPVEYDGLLTLHYGSLSDTASVSATLGYAGAAAPLLAMPDLSGVSGWPVATAFPAEAPGAWTMTAESATAATPLCAEGRAVVSATRSGSF